MITPRTAQRLVARHCRPLAAVSVPIAQALGRVLAESVRARVALPPFDNSSMDGYALAARSVAGASRARPRRLRIAGKVAAGGRPVARIAPGEACAVMTGAPLPRGADAVVPFEETRVEGDMLVISRPVPRQNYVRRRGEDVRRGARVLARGATVHAGTIACLAALGRDRVRVVRPPRVAIVTTGDELVAPGQPLPGGAVYDSNSAMLAAMVREAGIEPRSCRRVRDRAASVERAVAAALARCDVLVVSGGVSVGERDCVRGAFERAGVRTVFWRVRQKPGKPLYFGVRGEQLIFGLPGNPASAFVCFYAYVYPALRRLGGFARADLRERATVAPGVAGDAVRWQLLRAAGKGADATVLPKQGSHIITPLARAQSLVVVAPRAPRRARAPVLALPGREEDTS